MSQLEMSAKYRWEKNDEKSSLKMCKKEKNMEQHQIQLNRTLNSDTHTNVLHESYERIEREKIEARVCVYMIVSLYGGD